MILLAMTFAVVMFAVAVRGYQYFFEISGPQEVEVLFGLKQNIS